MPGFLFGNHLQSHWLSTEQNHPLLPTGHSLQVCWSLFLLLFFPNFCLLNALSPSSVSSLFSTQAAGTAWTAILGLVLASKGRCWERGLWGRSSWQLRKWAGTQRGGCFRGSNSYAGCKGIVYSWVVHSWIMVTVSQKAVSLGKSIESFIQMPCVVIITFVLKEIASYLGPSRALLQRFLEC